MHLLATKFSGTLLLVALGSLSWINSVLANIKFDNIPATTPLNPGESITLTWTEVNSNGTVLNTNPIDLQLRALTGQQYDLDPNVAQNALTATVTIPKTATGGLVRRPVVLFIQISVLILEEASLTTLT